MATFTEAENDECEAAFKIGEYFARKMWNHRWCPFRTDHEIKSFCQGYDFELEKIDKKILA